MPDEKKEEANLGADKTADQIPPVDEKKDDKTIIEEENVTVSKKELEDLRKRADDFNRSVELKRLAKLGKTELPAKNDDELVNKVNKLEEKLSNFEANNFNSGLSEAYRQFVSENPWANSDEVFDKIKDNFNSAGTETKEELFSKLKGAAQKAFPAEYEKHLEDKIKAKILSEKINTPAGGGASSADILHKDDNNVETEETLREKRLGSLLREKMTWIKK